MNILTLDTFNDLIKNSSLKSKTKVDLKFVRSTESVEDWSVYELMAITDRTGDRGVLLMQPGDKLYLAEYELSRKIIDSKTGRARAIICDFCYTWQPGSNAASIRFTHATNKHKIGFLCCGDLKCSLHVRTMTHAANMSRSQLRENMSNEDRVLRLKQRLTDKIAQIGLF